MKRHANAAIFVPHAGCSHSCAFCDQRGISGADGIPDDSEVTRTLQAAAKSLGDRITGAEIAFFGGSFTAIPREEMLRLLKAAQPFLGPEGFAGIRVSTRPDAIDRDTLGILSEYGVTSIELGAQSMDDAVLAACGRGHTAEDVVRASELIRAGGISPGLQMMTGLPRSTNVDSIATANAIIALCPDTVRIYPTLALEGTALAKLWRAGSYEPQTLDNAVELCSMLLERFTEHGVRVIRLGLHDSGGVREGYLAGPYHPAFRELCEGEILLRRALTVLAGIPSGEVTLTVSKGSTSRLAGHNRRNRNKLASLGYNIKIIEDESLNYLEVKAIV